MKIIYCIQSLANSGGMERVLSNKVNYWVNKGYDISIVTTDQMNNPKFFYFDPRIKLFDLSVNYQDNNSKSIFIKAIQYPGKLIKNKRRLKKLVKHIDPDIIVSMFDNDAMILPFIRCRSKKVLEIHFSKYWRLSRNRSGLWRLIDNIRTKIDSWLTSKFDHFVVLTNEDRELWSQKDNISVIPNALTFDNEKVSSLVTNRVIAVGRYDFQKNFENLIDIWSFVYPNNRDWNLTIIGDGVLREKLNEKIIGLGLENCITLEKPSKNMEMWYLDSSIYVMTSRYEGLPMVLLEAQSMGLPIISYTCQCGPRDVVTDGKDGYLISMGDMETFAEKLDFLMNNRDDLVRLGKEAKISSARFGEITIMHKWTLLFENLVK